MRAAWIRRAVAAAAIGAGTLFAGGVGATLAGEASAFPSECQDAGKGSLSCTVPSATMKSTATVTIRPGTPVPGKKTQAIYIVGADDFKQRELISAQYGPEYTLVSVEYAESGWVSDWKSPPRGLDGGTFWNQTGGTYNPQWATFIGTELPAYLDTTFDVAPTGNAIVGLGESGAQAITLALDNPKLFTVANSIGGFYQTDSSLGYALIPTMLALRHGIVNGFNDLWGNPFDPNSRWAAHDPSKRIGEAKTNGQTIIISAGSSLNPVTYLSALMLNRTVAALNLPVSFVYGSTGNGSREAALVKAALTKGTLAKVGGSPTANVEKAVSELSVNLSDSAAPTVLTAPDKSAALSKAAPSAVPRSTVPGSVAPSSAVPGPVAPSSAAPSSAASGPGAAAPSAAAGSSAGSGSADTPATPSGSAPSGSAPLGSAPSDAPAGAVPDKPVASVPEPASAPSSTSDSDGTTSTDTAGSDPSAG